MKDRLKFLKPVPVPHYELNTCFKELDGWSFLYTSPSCVILQKDGIEYKVIGVPCVIYRVVENGSGGAAR